MRKFPRSPQTALVLQGGGALGAYQAGASIALAAADFAPDWVAGISIGAINAALIAGNRPADRVERLRAFWEGVCVWQPGADWFPALRPAFQALAQAQVVARGVPGFFAPRVPAPQFATPGSMGATSWYDTAPLARTLAELVDFDWLNAGHTRLSVGAVDVELGNFAYFDSHAMTIGPAHIMASGALPPGFGAVKIDGRCYWDGGLVSNTPLHYILENAGADPLQVFQVDLFSARGPIPQTLDDVVQRQKDIQYSSRTRLNTDHFAQMHNIGQTARRLRAKLPAALRDDPELVALCETGPRGPVTLMHLIHRHENFEGQAKDYDFSAPAMRSHWAAGERDVLRSLHHPDWINHKMPDEGLSIFDLAEMSLEKRAAS